MEHEVERELTIMYNGRNHYEGTMLVDEHTLMRLCKFEKPRINEFMATESRVNEPVRFLETQTARSMDQITTSSCGSPEGSIVREESDPFVGSDSDEESVSDSSDEVEDDEGPNAQPDTSADQPDPLAAEENNNLYVFVGASSSAEAGWGVISAVSLQSFSGNDRSNGHLSEKLIQRHYKCGSCRSMKLFRTKF